MKTFFSMAMVPLVSLPDPTPLLPPDRERVGVESLMIREITCSCVVSMVSTWPSCVCFRTIDNSHELYSVSKREGV